MSDIIASVSKRIQDLSVPEELVHVYILSPGFYTKYYKTKLTPIVLTPGKSGDHGSDVRLVDPNGNTRSEWMDSYKTAIGDVSVWTKPNQSSPVIRQHYILTIGDTHHDINGSLGGSL